MTEPDILVQTDAGIGRIRLNRPRQINALTVPMMHTIAGLLQDFAADDAVRAVELTGAGERGLCAGADVRALRELVLTGGDVRDFFVTEYGVNLAIAGFGKPYRAAMTGITMGGGLGLSAHGSRRVVDATSRLAMPETQIGLFPDVLMTPMLARMPGEVGTHLALTGASVNAADAVRLGLADEIAGEAPAADARLDADWIAECYAGDDPAEIIGRLEGHADPAARETAAELRQRSPLSVAVTLEALRRAASITHLPDLLPQELGLAVRLATGPDFAEGVRAQLVDRDRTPHWSHTGIEDVSRAEVLSYFQPLDRIGDGSNSVQNGSGPSWNRPHYGPSR
ncbi:MAG TPA: enoyl-CoA hydratase/isomerase family protein [Propionicimonas sp.]|uniref:enoyl-CoA hydratase/isomerase family protein n=1 Tax=Propionicimonas sp. TaxID=1955623 RepID=UPI002F417FF5